MEIGEPNLGRRVAIVRSGFVTRGRQPLEAVRSGLGCIRG